MPGNAEAIVGRHSRAIRILTCLQSGPIFNAKELASRMHVSRRTIYRDLNLIRGAGIRVEFDERCSGYRVSDGSPHALAPPGFTDRDLAKLALTSHLSLLHGFPQLGDAIRESVARLLGYYSADVRESVSRLLNCCVVDIPAPEYPSQSVEILEKLLGAVTAGRLVRTTFLLARNNRPVSTKLAPYRIVASLQDWSVVGRSSIHRRTMRIPISRLISVQVTDEPFELPKNFRTRKLRDEDRLPLETSRELPVTAQSA
jgi:predicted DNA-binding transcriptional regulator YafY